MGVRTGKPRGRPPGSKSKRTEERELQMAEAAERISQSLGVGSFDGDAHAFLMAIYKNPEAELNLRIDAAKAAIRYEKPALSSVEAKVDANVKTEPTEIAIRLVKPIGTPAS